MFPFFKGKYLNSDVLLYKSVRISTTSGLWNFGWRGMCGDLLKFMVSDRRFMLASAGIAFKEIFLIFHSS